VRLTLNPNVPGFVFRNKIPRIPGLHGILVTAFATRRLVAALLRSRVSMNQEAWVYVPHHIGFVQGWDSAEILSHTRYRKGVVFDEVGFQVCSCGSVELGWTNHISKEGSLYKSILRKIQLLLALFS
jgi:hypothetical protein